MNRVYRASIYTFLCFAFWNVPFLTKMKQKWIYTKYDIMDIYTIILIQNDSMYVSGLLCMMTSSNGDIFRVTGPLCGEFTGTGEFPTRRPVTRSFDVFFDLRLNKRLSKQPWGCWFETPSWSLWRQCNVCECFQTWDRDIVLFFKPWFYLSLSTDLGLQTTTLPPYLNMTLKTQLAG